MSAKILHISWKSRKGYTLLRGEEVRQDGLKFWTSALNP